MSRLSVVRSRLGIEVHAAGKPVLCLTDVDAVSLAGQLFGVAKLVVDDLGRYAAVAQMRAGGQVAGTQRVDDGKFVMDGDIEDMFTLTLAVQKREIELLRAAVRSAGDGVDSFGIDEPGTTAGRTLDAIDLVLGRPMSAVRIWNGHLENCRACNYDLDCVACVADGEHPPEHHACNCPVNGTGPRLRAAADAEAKAAL